MTEREQVLVADAEERPAQDADEGDDVLRIAERPQQQRKLRDLLRFPERAGPAHFNGHPQPFERLGVRREVLPLPCEHEEVAERPALAIHLGPDEARNPFGLGAWHVRRLVH